MVKLSCTKMSEKQNFKALLNEKLTEMTQEISELFDRMIVQHEREILILKQKSTRQQQLLISVKKPRVVLRRSDVLMSHCRVEVNPLLDKETEPPHIKEEQEELQESMHPPVSVKNEEEEEENSIAIHPNSSQKLNTDKCRSDKQTHQHSAGVKHRDRSRDSEDISEITDDQSTSSPELNNSDSDIQSTSDSEDSDQWSPESEPGQAPQRAALKSQFGKSLKTKRSQISGSRKQSKSDEGSEIIFECAQCRKTFLRRTSSVRHTAESITHCSACSAKLKQRSSVCRGTFHRPKKRFVCSICKKGFTRSDNLSSHMLIHKGERPHSCTVCTKSFKKQGHLKAHVRIHTGEKPFSCTVCKKSFRHRATCDRHERNHQGKRPFSCSDCGAKFKQRAHYQCHLVVHSGERPFSCTVCEKTYTRKSHVTAHMKLQHAKKPEKPV